MNRAILNDRLVRLITTFSQGALQGRQVGRRLDSLLPQRLRELKREYSLKVKSGKAASGETSSRSERIQAKAERCALTDGRYIAFLEELAAVQGEAVASRIQYETHTMLLEARRSLRPERR